MKKHWSMLNGNMNLSKSFKSKPITFFTRKKNSVTRLLGTKQSATKV